ncbi:MAG TPA: sigma-70 family RNA polymerase sigma factor [Actinomycetota bacterium]|nr:sigma-70 family RNA polymerase sigma factor [Actinomycetota bacterium]
MAAPSISPTDLELVARLRAGDEDAFMMLVTALGPSMRRVARMYVSTDAVADEVVQDAWVGVLRGLGSFEGRSTLRTWIFRILVNIAKTRGQREGRSVPFATLAGDDLQEPSIDPSAFRGPDDPAAGSWSTLPFDWRGMPEQRAEGSETIRVIGRAIATLPPLQAEVIRLRDVQGWSSEEVRNALDLSETNQRVLLHRARARVRRALEEHLRSVSQA